MLYYDLTREALTERAVTKRASGAYEYVGTYEYVLLQCFNIQNGLRNNSS